MANKHTTIEFTFTICNCGKELSTLFYFLTAENSFLEFAREIGLSQKDIDNMEFIPKGTDLPNLEGENLMICCLNSLRFGVTCPVSAFKHDEIVFRVRDKESKFGRKYPDALPGALSTSETLSWL